MIQHQKIMKLIIASMLILYIGGCKKPYEELSLQRMDYIGNELRTNGYYYCYYEDGIIIRFLFRNGIIKLCGSFPSIQDFENCDNPCSGSSSKIGWGVFFVDKDIIKHETWRGSPGFEKLPTEIFEGKILNDTTFHITKYYLSNGENSSAKNMLFHFKQFSPKPDSTAANKWIN